MNTFLIRHRIIRTLAFVLASSLAGFASEIGTFDRTFQVNGPVDLEVLTRSGDITVRNGAAGTVSFHSRIHSGNYWFVGIPKQDRQILYTIPPIRTSDLPTLNVHAHPN